MPQTIESIKILRQYKTPFVIALNKVDTIQGWQCEEGRPFVLSERQQQAHTLNAFNERLYAIIGDLIELGIDVLNPLQCSCPEMESVRLHREFGAELTFMGGVDTQRLLPCGEAAEVYDKTAELIDTMLADHGSYILAASHTVPPETPLDNIFAMYAAAGLTKEQILHNAEILRGREP